MSLLRLYKVEVLEFLGNMQVKSEKYNSTVLTLCNGRLYALPKATMFAVKVGGKSIYPLDFSQGYFWCAFEGESGVNKTIAGNYQTPVSVGSSVLVDKNVYYFDRKTKKIKSDTLQVETQRKVWPIERVYRDQLLVKERRVNNLISYDLQLNENWVVSSEKMVFSSCVTSPQVFNELFILNVGEDNTPKRGNFELNAYQAATGELVWQQIFHKSPASANLIGDKVFVVFENHTGTSEQEKACIVDAATGQIVLDFTHSQYYKMAYLGEGEQQRLLCFSHKTHNIDVLTANGSALLATIELPRPYGFHWNRAEAPVIHDNTMYLTLTSRYVDVSGMKGGLLTLTADDVAKLSGTVTVECEPRPTFKAQREVCEEKSQYQLSTLELEFDWHRWSRLISVEIKGLIYAKSNNSILEAYNTKHEGQDAIFAGQISITLDEALLNHLNKDFDSKDELVEALDDLCERINSNVGTMQLAGDGVSQIQVSWLQAT